MSRTSGLQTWLHIEHPVSGCVVFQALLPVPVNSPSQKTCPMPGTPGKLLLFSQPLHLAGAPALHTLNLSLNISGLEILGLGNFLMSFLIEKAHGLVKASIISSKDRSCSVLYSKGDTNHPAVVA